MNNRDVSPPPPPPLYLRRSTPPPPPPPQEKGEERKEGLEKEQGLAAINAVECFSADSVRGLPYATSDHAEPGDGQQQFEPPWGVKRNLKAR